MSGKSGMKERCLHVVDNKTTWDAANDFFSSPLICWLLSINNH